MEADPHAIVINGRATKWMLGIFSTAVGLMIALLINVNISYGEKLAEIERFQARTEANRFTQSDGFDLWAQVVTYIADNTPAREVIIRLERLESYHNGER